MSRRREQREGVPDRNKVRRTQYASDPAIAENAREASRARYREQNPLPPSRLRNGLLTRGTEREVTIPGRARTRLMETYTIPEAADALGKSLPNFRRWLANELLPGPILTETARSNACYTVEELEIIARELAAHERQFAYLCEKHVETITRISQMIHGLRDVEFGSGNGRTR